MAPVSDFFDFCSPNFFQEKDDSQRKKKESIVDLSRFMDKRVRVKFQGGREGANCCIP